MFIKMALNIAAMLAMLVAMMLTSRFHLHFLQLESYYLAGYRRFMLKRWWVFAVIALPALIALTGVDYLCAAVVIAQAVVLCVVGKREFKRTNIKKPLVITARIKRLMTIEAVIMIIPAVILGVLTGAGNECAFFGLIPVLLPFIVALAAIIAMPLEYSVRRYYINDAKKILKARPDLKIIGITGSYGKTSTKFLLSTILSEKYSVLTPPSSYNTTLGVVRVIRERLQPDDEIFICEMGSRHVGDIDQICSFVKPDVGIITSIGPQHLETFGSMDNIVKGKFELIKAVKSTAFFPLGNEYTEKMYDMAQCEKYAFAVDKECYMYAQGLTVSPDGSCFALVNGKGESVFCTTALLGEHNVQNIVGCAAIAYHMGLTMEQIARGISKLKPVEHRLQIVSRRPVTVIDDAFNSSPNGAKAALKVLSGFAGRRIIVTPGFVELGDELEKYHFELGKQIASSAEVAILVGSRTESIKKGIESAGFNMENVRTVSDLDEATAYLASISVAGDTVLFENDLPDNY